MNDKIVHGIPSAGEKLREGDLISIDFGAIVDGWHGDSAITVGVGALAPEDARLSEVCERSMWDGLAAARVGGRLTDISHAVETSIRHSGPYGIVANYGGHGIGTEMHMAIEPMVTRGSRATRELDDGWTVVTVDGSRSAHWEHTVALLDDGPWVPTAPDGGRAELGARGVTVSAAA